MGCHQCYECGEKFEAYVAEEYAGEDEEPDYETCPDCLEKAAKQAKKDDKMKRQEAELLALREEVKSLRKNKKDDTTKRQEAELEALRAENKSLREKLAASSTIDLTNDDESDDDSDSDTKQPATKKAKISGTVWVIVKGDWPDQPRSQLVHVDVLGTYSSEEKAETAMEEFIEEGGWMRGYGYHQGSSSESTIQIISRDIDDPAE